MKMKLEDKFGIIAFFAIFCIGAAMLFGAIFDAPVVFIRVFIGAIGASLIFGAAITAHHIITEILSEDQK